MKYSVYNYETQKWEDNKTMLIAQLNDDIQSLSDPEYLKFIGYNEQQAAEARSNIQYRLNNIK